MTDFGRRPVPVDHASRHENNGLDEVDASGLSGLLTYTDRGDLGSFDKVLADLTMDSTYYDWDISAICPAGTVLVGFRVWLRTDLSAVSFSIRSNGNSNVINIFQAVTSVGSVIVSADGWVAPDSDRKVEYIGVGGYTYTVCNVLIFGWFI
ncbi:MAG: hypothetical protein FVQ85_21665 [Planctomycetes bacterium]|nr:hypothetical protein [Planctomycetota bacterium]